MKELESKLLEILIDIYGVIPMNISSSHLLKLSKNTDFLETMEQFISEVTSETGIKLVPFWEYPGTRTTTLLKSRIVGMSSLSNISETLKLFEDNPETLLLSAINILDSIVYITFSCEFKIP